MKLKEIKITVLGLGYVGIVLANEFSKKYSCIGYDIDKKRISELKNNIDRTQQLKAHEIKKSKILFTSNNNEIRNSNIYIITVPTPIYTNKKPNLNIRVEQSTC